MLINYFYSFFVRTEQGGHCSNSVTEFEKIVTKKDLANFKRHIQGENSKGPTKVLLSFQEIEK